MSISKGVAFLKGAIERGPVAGIMGCYFVREGMMYAHNEYVQAGMPFASADETDFIVPATELEFTVARMKGDPTVTVDEGEVYLKHGRMRSTIQSVEGEPPPMADLEGEWFELPKGFCKAMKIAAKFAGDNGWTASVRLTDNLITAITNTRGINIEMPGLEVGTAKMLALRSVEFLCATEEPVAYMPGETFMMFQWDDGRWARFQLLAVTYPESVDKILAGAMGEVPVAITPDWRAAYEDVSALSEDAVTIHAAGIEGKKGAAKVLVEIECPELKGRTRWRSAEMDPMLEVATHWAPNNHPNASPFAGEGMRGLVMGVQR